MLVIGHDVGIEVKVKMMMIGMVKAFIMALIDWEVNISMLTPFPQSLKFLLLGGEITARPA